MKNYKCLSLVLIIGLAMLGGCTKDLETKPDTVLTELKTFDDVRSALRGAYDGFQSTNYYNSPPASGSGSGWSTLPDLMGDDFVEALESLGNWNSLSEMTYAADNGQITGLYVQAYDIITRVDNLLQALPAYENGANAAEAKRIRAQALAIRAHVHFDLMRYFAQDFDRNSTKLGIAYVTTFDPQKPFANLPKRNTVKENYDAIYQDLADALVNFRSGGNTTSNSSRFYIDSTVVHAIRARVSYYASQWSDVISETSIALARRPLGNSAAFIASFDANRETNPPSEVYWQIPSEGSLQPGGAISGEGPNYRVTAAMTEILQSQGGAYVDEGIVLFDQDGVGNVNRTLLWKYPGINSFKVYRAGEMILMRAEAKYHTGDATAIDDLNLLRTNRGVATGSETGTALLDAILLQRRVELLGEGFRWFDIRRTTRTIVRAECGTAGGSRASNCNINSQNRGWTFPIPFDELKVNPNLSQNDGY